MKLTSNNILWSIEAFRITLFSCYLSSGVGWVRLLGNSGVMWKCRSRFKHFEKQCLKWSITIGNFRIGVI